MSGNQCIYPSASFKLKQETTLLLENCTKLALKVQHYLSKSKYYFLLMEINSLIITNPAFEQVVGCKLRGELLPCAQLMV
jgi:hypothetical protein